MYAAQARPQFDADIAGKGHLWMDTTYEVKGGYPEPRIKGQTVPAFHGLWMDEYFYCNHEHEEREYAIIYNLLFLHALHGLKIRLFTKPSILPAHVVQSAKQICKTP